MTNEIDKVIEKWDNMAKRILLLHDGLDSVACDKIWADFKEWFVQAKTVCTITMDQDTLVTLEFLESLVALSLLNANNKRREKVGDIDFMVFVPK